MGNELFEFFELLTHSENPTFIRDQRFASIGKVPVYLWIASTVYAKTVVSTLDRFLFTLDDERWFLMAWRLLSTMPEEHKPKRWVFLKTKKDPDESIQIILDNIRTRLRASDNDWNTVRGFYVEDIEKNTLMYAKALGLDKKAYKQLGLEYEKYEVKKEKVIALDFF